MNLEVAIALFRSLVKAGRCPFCRRKDAFKETPTLDDTKLYKCSSCGDQLIVPPGVNI
jgi:transposase-like protein